MERGRRAPSHIPFADRIDGAGRFRPARPPKRWHVVRKTQAWVPLTPQIADVSVVRDEAYHRFLFGRFYDTPMSEEGLFLNLWTPVPERGAKRPVMVWLHGGGFAVGTPTRAREEPSLLSARGDIVVVAPNHRLGAFGYLYLEGDAQASITPNLGMLDIVAALEWVQENIEFFGGDPSNVTVFGEFGGAMKTATLLSLPKAKGLFHRGICQAGVFAPGFRFGPLARGAADEALITSCARKRLPRARGTADGRHRRRAGERRGRVDGMATGRRRRNPPCRPGASTVRGARLDVPMIVGWAAHEADFIFRGTPFTIEELDSSSGRGPGPVRRLCRRRPRRKA